MADDLAHRVMTAKEAVSRFVVDGAVIGLGGQNINRCPMALTYEIARQRPQNLSIVGCNLSMPLDVLVVAGVVVRTEQGSANLERYGGMAAWRRHAEAGDIVSVGHSHLAMASRFAAASLGLPFLPTLSLLGSDVLAGLQEHDIAVVTEDPWSQRPTVLLRALAPDVAVIHASCADEGGNLYIDGVSSHELEMVRAARATIASVERIVDRDEEGLLPEQVAVPNAFVDAIVVQPFGAWPTAVYRHYDFDEDEVVAFQANAKVSDDQLRTHLTEGPLGEALFGDFLEHIDPDGQRRQGLESAMAALV